MLKIKNFNIKPKVIDFKSCKFATDLEKKKIYINFIKFLNNHFKRTLFKKNLYNHFHLHMGFIAHYNIDGFYGVYFQTAAIFHTNVNGYKHKISENCGDLNQKSDEKATVLFKKIYDEINGSRTGLGEFFEKITKSDIYSYHDDYHDINTALKDAFCEYLEHWVENIRDAIRDNIKKAKQKEQKSIKKLSNTKQTTLFDFLEVA